MYRTIASFFDPLEAYIVLGRLQAEGIEAHIADDQINLANWEWRQAIGGTKIRVADADFERARAIVAELDRGEFALEAPPMPVAPPDRETFSSRIAFVFLFMLGLPLPWRRKAMPADDGGKETQASV